MRKSWLRPLFFLLCLLTFSSMLLRIVVTTTACICIVRSKQLSLVNAKYVWVSFSPPFVSSHCSQSEVYLNSLARTCTSNSHCFSNSCWESIVLRNVLWNALRTGLKRNIIIVTKKGISLRCFSCDHWSTSHKPVLAINVKSLSWNGNAFFIMIR
jgi:hypothetical protein